MSDAGLLRLLAFSALICGCGWACRGGAQDRHDAGPLNVELGVQLEAWVSWEAEVGERFLCDASHRRDGRCLVPIRRRAGLHTLRIAPIEAPLPRSSPFPDLRLPLVPEEVLVDLTGRESQIYVFRDYEWSVWIDFDEDLLEVSPSGDSTCPWLLRNRGETAHWVRAVSYGAGTLTAVAWPQIRTPTGRWVDMAALTREPGGSHSYESLTPGASICAAVPDVLRAGIPTGVETRTVAIVDEDVEHAGLTGTSIIRRRTFVHLPPMGR